MYALICIQTSD